MNETRLSPPWETYYKKVKAFFSYEEDVEVSDFKQVDESTYEIKLTVDNATKAFALSRVVGPVTFGNITVKCEVTLKGIDSTEELLDKAFNGHSAVAWAANKPFPGGEAKYLLFYPEIIQFFNDDLSSYDGLFTALIADVARDVLDLSGLGVIPCTVDIRKD